MLPILGTVFGFVSGFLPELLKLFREREDRKHELAILQMQMEAQRLGHVQRLEEINVTADVEQERLAIQASKVDKSGVRWIDGLLALVTGLVRPAITYSFFGLYAAVKWSQYLLYVRGGNTGADAVSALWTQDDMAIFCTVVGFWFSGRLLQKFLGRK